MTIIDIIFYAIFISQIFLISYHYPKKTYDRSMYVLRNFPAADYPKLYQHSQYTDPSQALHKTFRRYLFANVTIALFGVGLLVAMAVNGYAPSGIKENQDLIFIIFFFMLQAIPHILLELSARNSLKGMRNADRSNTRKADLNPRKLFDFVSPPYVVLAVLAFIAWVAYYLYNKGFSTPWDWQSYITLLGMTGLNLVFIGLGYMLLRGKKQDPHQGIEDRIQIIKIMIRAYVFASILMSLQLIVFDVINQNGWDKFEPIALSIYFQVIMIFGIGEVIRRYKINDVDFSVYQNSPS